MGALARKFSRHRPKLLFDIRGFFPEEYTDAGVWPQDGWLYRAAKRVERWLMSEADGFVVLTENARGILFPESRESGYDASGRPVEVIPCCVDLDRFALLDRERRLAAKESLGLSGRRVYVHVGSLSGLYLADKLADLLATARANDPTVYALFLTQSSPANIAPLLESYGFGRDDFRVIKVPPAEVPKYLAASDVALSFVKAGYATASRSPTKIPEYLACGVPVIANRGVGDIDDLIERRRVGTLVENFSNDAYQRAVGEIGTLIDTEERCRKTAIEEFDLPSVGGERYRRLYRRLLQGNFHQNSRDEDLHNQS
jgi:glycosyltransferase involved in cell wall biosynthesis